MSMTGIMAGGFGGTRSFISGFGLNDSGLLAVPYFPERTAREQKFVESADGGGVEHEQSTGRSRDAMKYRDLIAQAEDSRDQPKI